LPIAKAVNGLSQQTGIDLLHQIVRVTERNTLSWKDVVFTILGIAPNVPSEFEYDFSQLLISTMSPVEIFRNCISNVDERTRNTVESLVRKYMPKTADTEQAPQQPQEDTTSTAQPAIKLKLKFGK
jgi:hypothetical protein